MLRYDKSLLPFSHIVLGVTGAVNASNSPELVLCLRPYTQRLTVVLTPHAINFVQPNSLRVIMNTEVLFFEGGNPGSSSHMTLAKTTDLLLIAPASANTLAKIASGIADNFLTTLALAVECGITVAPSMSATMWRNPRTQRNLKLLTSDGVAIIEPTTGTEVATLEPQFGAMPRARRVLEQVLKNRREREGTAYRHPEWLDRNHNKEVDMSRAGDRPVEGSAATLRTHMRGNVRFRFELLAAISKTAREHGIQLSDDAVGNLVLVDAAEIERELAGPDLPGGTNC